MTFYATERPEVFEIVTEDGTCTKYLKQIKPTEYKQKFPGATFEIRCIAGDRNIDGRFLLEIEIDAGHTQQEKDNFKAAILTDLGWTTAWTPTEAKAFADTVSTGTWTVNGEKIDPPA